MDTVKNVQDVLKSINKVKNSLRKLRSEIRNDTQIRYAISDLDNAEKDLEQIMIKLKNA